MKVVPTQDCLRRDSLRQRRTRLRRGLWLSILGQGQRVILAFKIKMSMGLVIDRDDAKREEIDPSQWGYVSGMVSVLETTLLKADFFQKLLQPESREGMLSCIRDSPLRDFFQTTRDVEDFEDILNRRYLTLVQELRRYSPSPAVCDFFQMPYDFMNLKNFLKEIIYGLPLVKHLPSPVGDDVLGDLWEGKRPPLPEVYYEAVSTLKEFRSRGSGIDASAPALVDIVLDGCLLRYLPTLVAGVNSGLIQKYVADYLKLRGILMLQRVHPGQEVVVLWFLRGDEFFERFLVGPPVHWKEALLEIVPQRVVEEIIRGDKKDLLSRYEKHTSDYLMEMLEAARYMVFGPERVFGYLAGLTAELFNLRLVIGGRLNRLSPQSIRGMLRRVYV